MQHTGTLSLAPGTRRHVRLGVMSILGVLLVACGSDYQSSLEQIDLPNAGEHPFLPVPVEFCESSVECEDGNRCTENRCLDGGCVSFTVPSEACCPADELFLESFENPAALSVSMHNLNDGAGWTLDDHRTTTGEFGLYFGNVPARSYDTGARVAGFVELPPVTLPRDRESVLSMRLHTLIETAVDFDIFYITAETLTPGVPALDSADEALLGLSSESRVQTIFGKADLPPAAFEGFALVDVPLTAFAGKTVVLRLHFDTLDGRDNAYEGIYLDDIAVESLCFVPLPCESDLDCTPEDSEGCLVGACSLEGCAVADICEPPAEPSPCDAADAPEGCCIVDADCDDGDPRTLNVCGGATCETTMNPDSCVVDADCNDGDSCTVARCEAGVCAFRGETTEACCVESDLDIANFDRDTLQGIYVTDNLETGIFWRTNRTRSTSGDFALYCGDPLTQTYAFERRVKSSATTRPLSIPSGGETTLVFDLYKHTRTTRHFDVFQVAILRDEGLFPLWTSKDLADGTTQGAWREIRVPLTDYAGQAIQVRFVFDSADAPPAGFEGTYIDTLRLETRCADK